MYAIVEVNEDMVIAVKKVQFSHPVFQFGEFA